MRGVFLLALLLAAPTPAATATFIVPAEFPTIQAAYDATGPFGGDTILVQTGTHQGGLIINKPLAILGDAGASFVQVQGGMFLVGVDGAHPNHGVGVHFRDLTFVDSSILLSYGGPYGTLVGGTVTDCIFRNSTVALDLDCSLTMTDNLFVEGNTKTAVSIFFFMGGYGNPTADIRRNTAVGYSTFVDVSFNGAYTFVLENNVIADCGIGVRVNQAPLPQWGSIECNDVFNCPVRYDGMEDPTGSLGNISVDPEFCDPLAGDFHLRTSSPCLPGNHPYGYACGLIGHGSAGCESPVIVETRTWGALKGLYRLPK